MFNKLLPLVSAVIFFACWEVIMAAPQRFLVMAGGESLVLYLFFLSCRIFVLAVVIAGY